MEISTYQEKLIATITGEGKINRSYIYDDHNLVELLYLSEDPVLWGLIGDSLEAKGIRLRTLETALERLRLQRNGSHRPRTDFPTPQTGTALLAVDFPPLRYFVEEILTEGLTILGGKPKKGKSYL